jgi:hypothetical protein
MATTSTTRSRRWIGLSLAAGAALVMVGCETPRVDQYRANPTPRLDTPAWTHDEIANRAAISNDLTLRRFNSDLLRIFHLDRPVHLTPGPRTW